MGKGSYCFKGAEFLCGMMVMVQNMNVADVYLKMPKTTNFVYTLS